MYIQDNKNNYVSNVFPVFLQSSSDIRTNPELHFLISKITVTSGPNDSNILSESDPNIGRRNYDLFTYLYIKRQKRDPIVSS